MRPWEWIGELFDPGDSGSIQMGGPDVGYLTRAEIILRLVGTGIGMGLIYAFVFLVVCAFDLENVLAVLAVSVVYLVLAYVLWIEPDEDNMGWFGGWMDDPFRVSDDVNRYLMLLKVVLIPGRFFATSLLAGLRLFRRPTEPSPDHKERRRHPRRF